MQVLRDDSPIQCQHGLDQARDSRRGFQVTDIRLHRTDQKRFAGVPAGPVDRCRGVDLDGVAHLGAGPVRLQVVDIRWLDTGPLQRRLDHAFLRRAVRDGQARARAVLVQCRAPDDAPDTVAVGLGIREPLQDQDAAAFAPDISVGGGIEGLALTVRRQHPRVGAKFEKPAGEDDVHATGESEVRVAALQARDRLVRRDQRRRAGGIHGHRRPPESERVGHPADRRVEGRAGDRIKAGGGFGGPSVLAGLEDQSAVVVVADTRIDAGKRVLEPLWVDARVLERPPARLQNQALLGVQQFRFHRRDAEEGGVKPVKHIEVEIGAVAARLDLSRVVGEQGPHAPDAGSRNAFPHRVPAAFQQAPEGTDAVRPGEPAGHADYRYGGAEFRNPLV